MSSEKQIHANRRNLAKRRGLTPEGRERLRQSAINNKPWQQATGPRTEAGRPRTRMNALTHGRDTSDPRVLRRDALRIIRLAAEYRRKIRGRESPDSPMMLVRAEALVRLAQRLEPSLGANRANHANPP